MAVYWNFIDLNYNLLIYIPCNNNVNKMLFGSNELDSDVNCQIFELVESYIYESGRFVI